MTPGLVVDLLVAMLLLELGLLLALATLENLFLMLTQELGVDLQIDKMKRKLILIVLS